MSQSKQLIDDRHHYYQVLADMIWPNRERILKTTDWSNLDRLATDEQKKEADDLVETLEEHRSSRSLRGYD